MSASLAVPPDAERTPAAITERSGSNFLAGFVCLDAARREAMQVVYAFCRVVDDAVDEAPDPEIARARLDYWQNELAAAGSGGEAKTPVGHALRRVMQEYSVPRQALEDLVAGCRTDIPPASGIPQKLADEAELELYCYRVASAVGLACLPIFGANDEGAQRYAIELGHALQLTNVLRDLRGDAEIGRCYVPQSWLTEFGIAAEDLLGRGEASLYASGSGGVTRLCERLAERARQRFANARREQGQLSYRERRALVAPRIMGAVYRDVLAKLEKRAGNLLLPRCRVAKPRKIWLLSTVWLGVRW
ncbi:MAG: phytoene/squalene synthase family protein [Planctomycetota bacterium]